MQTFEQLTHSTFYLVEATAFESLCLLSEMSKLDRPELSYKNGEVHTRHVDSKTTIKFTWVSIRKSTSPKTFRVCFWAPTSDTVDYDVITKYLKQHFPRIPSCSAEEFYDRCEASIIAA